MKSINFYSICSPVLIWICVASNSFKKLSPQSHFAIIIFMMCVLSTRNCIPMGCMLHSTNSLVLIQCMLPWDVYLMYIECFHWLQRELNDVCVATLCKSWNKMEHPQCCQFLCDVFGAFCDEYIKIIVCIWRSKLIRLFSQGSLLLKLKHN